MQRQKKLRSKLYPILIVLIIFSPSIKGQAGYETQILKGLALAYNFQLDESEKAFSRAMQIEPARPEAYHYIAQIHLWAFLGSKDISELKIFNRWSEISVSKAEELLKKSGKDPKLHYLLGYIYLLKAMAYGADNSNLSAFGASKTSFSYFEESLSIRPDLFDSYRGMGLFHYALDFIPGIFKWAVSLSGIKPDRERGLNYLRTAYRKGNLDKPESAFHLAKIYADFAGEYDSAFTVLKPLLNQYPANPVFNYQAAVILLKSGHLSEAEKYINKVIAADHPAVKQMNSLAQFVKGDIYFLRNDFVNAEKYYTGFIDNALDADYCGIASLRLAFCRLINGKKDLYKKALLEARNGNTDIHDDEYAKEFSERLNGRELYYEEIILLKESNNFAAGKYQDVIKSLNSSINAITIGDNKARAYLLIAECSMALKNSADAQKYLTLAESIKPSNEKWIIPRRLYVKAEIELQNGNRKKAGEYCEEALDENDYQFSDEISTLLYNLRQRIFKK